MKKGLTKSGKVALTASIGVGLVLMLGSQTTEAAQTRAQADLSQNEQQVREQAARNVKVENVKDVAVSVKDVVLTGNEKMSKESLLALIPELKKSTVHIHELAKQLQQVNDNGALTLSTDFKPAGDNSYIATLKVKENDPEHVNVNISNTGNDFTGDWRLTTSYINTNVTRQNDTVGVAYVTSPGHWDDVKQAAVSYRLPIPADDSSVNFNFSYSDVNMGSVYSSPGLLDLTASGKSATAGVHYQHNVAYTSREKDILDFGVDYKRYSNNYRWTILGSTAPNDYDFHVATAALDFLHNDRSDKHAFTYDAGYVTNFDGNETAYEKATSGSDKHFGYWKAGTSYLYRMPADWRVSMRVHGQYTNDNLVSTEQIGAGGIYSVRGFDERVLSADTGYVGSFEIYTPEFAPSSRFVLFTDWGDLTNNNKNSLFHHERVASAGAGYRFQRDDFSLLLDYARVIDDADSVALSHHQDHQRWNFMMNAKL